MSDVFVSYAREDQHVAERLVEMLQRHGFDVWFDADISAGDTFPTAIERAISSASCVLVLWSRNSVASNWVLEEASVARERGVLIPVLIEPAQVPLGFRQYQAADLSSWRGDPSAVELEKLLADVSNMVKRSAEHKPPPAPDTEAAGGRPRLPTIVPAAWQRIPRAIRYCVLAVLVIIITFVVREWPDPSKNGPPPTQVKVPDVVGLTTDKATAQLMGVGLEVGGTSRKPGPILGTILEQEPRAGKLVDPQSSVYLTVAVGIAVPNLVGLDVAVAKSTLDQLDLRLGNLNHSPESNRTPGTIVTQSPVAGTEVPLNSAIDIVLAGISVPDVVGLEERQAIEKLQIAKLAIGQITTSPTSIEASRTVLSQRPAANAMVRLATEVDLVVALPPTVPDVVGLTRPDAESALEEIGLKLGSVLRLLGQRPLIVLQQTPGPGHRVRDDATVDLLIGPSPRAINGKRSPLDLTDCVAFGDGDSLIALATDGVIQTTIDGGNTWKEANVAPRQQLRGICSASNGRFVFVLGDDATLFRSEDGAATWKQVRIVPKEKANAASIEEIACSADGQHVWVVGDNLAAYSKDFGVRWEQIKTHQHYDAELRSVYVSPTGKRVCVGGSRHGGNRWYPLIRSSSDFGTKWKEQLFSEPLRISYPTVYSIVASDTGSTLWAVVSNRKRPLSNSSIYKSEDESASWSWSWQSTAEIAIEKLFVPTTPGRTEFWGMGENTIYTSLDEGHTWGVKTVGRAVASVAGRIWVVGDGGLMMQSTDNGATWRTIGFSDVPVDPDAD